jgi:type II secretory pathway pseudopilin PulG
VRPTVPAAVSERGAALVLTLMVVALVGGLGGALLLVMSMETAVQAHHQQVQLVRQAAESGLACAVADLRRAADWTLVLSSGPGPAGSCLEAAALPPPWPNAASLDVQALTETLQAATRSRYGLAPDTPHWTFWIMGAAPGNARGSIAPVVLVWIADDVEDGDGDAGADANGVVWVRAEAWGPAGARAAVEAIVRRAPEGDPPAAVAGWRIVR